MDSAEDPAESSFSNKMFGTTTRKAIATLSDSQHCTSTSPIKCAISVPFRHSGLVESPSDSSVSDTSYNAFTSSVLPVLSIVKLLGLCSISFSYGFVFNSVNCVVIPKEIERLTHSHHAMWLGLIMAAGAFCQLSAPMVGAVSDRSGRRMPFLIYGSVITIVGLFIFLLMASSGNMGLLFVAHMTVTVGLSTQYSIMTSLLSDCVGEEQVGTGSGVMAMLAMLGSGMGYGMFALRFSNVQSYIGYMIAVVSCLSLTAIFLPRDYYEKDFAWACLSRALFNGGLSGQVYLVFYLRDIIQLGDPSQIMSWIAAMSLFGGVLAAIPTGIISDKVGKKPVVYISIFFTVSCLAFFMVATTLPQLLILGFCFGIGNVAYLSVDYAIGVQVLPRVDDSDSPPVSPKEANMVSVVRCHLSKDSLTPTSTMCTKVSPHETPNTTDVMSAPPTRKFSNGHLSSTSPSSSTYVGSGRTSHDAAKDLGLFAMASTLGQLTGQILYGAILHLFQQPAISANLQVVGYSHFGYVLVYSFGGLLFLLSGLCVPFIEGIR